MFEEWNETKLREKNIVIYGVKESNSSGIDDRVKHGQLFVKSLLDTCGVETGPSFMEVIGKMVRFGKRTEEREKGMPLLVQFVQGNLKRKLFSKISMLRGKPEYNDVSISHDLTKLQRAREEHDGSSTSGCKVRSKRPSLETKGNKTEEKRAIAQGASDYKGARLNKKHSVKRVNNDNVVLLMLMSSQMID